MGTYYYNANNGVINGIHPDITANEGHIVEVHENNSSGLFYSVGKWKADFIEFGEPVRYDNGEFPSCSITENNILVEAHNAQWGSSDMWYHVGTVEDGAVLWGKSHKYHTGRFPRISVNRELFVFEVHESQAHATCYCNMGRVNTREKTIDFMQSANVKYSDGVSPAADINDSYDVVEVHKQDSHFYCMSGYIRPDEGSLFWVKRQEIPFYKADSVTSPAVAITNERRVCVMFQYQDGMFDTPYVYSLTGRYTGNEIQWDGCGCIGIEMGDTPAVALWGERAACIHLSSNNKTLWHATGKLQENGRWMERMENLIGNRKLNHLILPASHDSGMYVQSLPFVGRRALNQDLTTRQQLEYGIRYFDFRPVYEGWPEEFYMEHGGNRGVGLSRVMEDTRSFLMGSKEVIFFKIYHAYSLERMLDRFISLLFERLGVFLYRNSAGRRLCSTTYREFVADGCGKVLILLDWDESPLPQIPKGFYIYKDYQVKGDCDIRIFDQYSNTKDFQRMKQDQLTKYRQFDSEAELFLLSWTLSGNYVKNVSKPASRNAGAVLLDQEQLPVPNRKGRLPNLLYADFVSEADITGIAIELNKRME